MITQELSRKVLYIGPEFKNPRGGIAQILHTYNSSVVESMRVITNSSSGRVRNIFLMGWSLLQEVATLLCHREIAIVHIHTASRRSFVRSSYYQRVAKWLGRKVVMHIHGGGFANYYNSKPQNMAFVKRVLSRSDMVLALTPGWVERFKADLGVDAECLCNAITSPQHVEVQPDGKVHILFMGLITPKKGVFDLVSAMALIPERLQHLVVLHICGNGDADGVAKVHQMIEENNLSHFVHFEGWVRDEQRTKLLNRCEILVLPSYIEALPLSILEAMAQGMAIVATRVGGIPTIVNDGVNGFLVEPGNKQELACRITELLDNEDLRKRCGEQSIAAVSKYLPDKVADELAALYDSLLRRE